MSDYYPGELVLSGLVWAFFLIFSPFSMAPHGKEDEEDLGAYYGMAYTTLVKMREAIEGIHEVLLSAQVLFLMIFLLSLLFTSSFRTWGCRLWCRVPTSGSC